MATTKTPKRSTLPPTETVHDPIREALNAVWENNGYLPKDLHPLIADALTFLQPPKQDSIYMLPPAINAALSTDRPELARVWVQQIKELGDAGVPNSNTLAHIGQLVADMIADRVVFKQEIQMLKAKLRETNERMQIAINSLNGKNA